MDLMKDTPDNFYDLAIPDPPYYSGPNKRGYYGRAESRTKIKRVNYIKIDDWEVPGEAYFKELFRVSKHQIIWGCNYYVYQFGPGRIIWDKCNGKNTFSDAEIAYCSYHDSVRLFRYMWNGMMQGKSISEGHIQQGNKKLNEKRIHPCQKPVNLYLAILQEYTQARYKILDTHAGSGSSYIACKKLGLECTAIEKNLDMYNLATERIREETSQMELREFIDVN